MSLIRELLSLNEASRSLVFRNARDVINHLVDEFDHKLSYAELHAFFVGGNLNTKKVLDMLVADGFDDAGAWEENKQWWKRHGINKTAFNMLVKASG